METLREKIEDRIADLPDGQVADGVYVSKIGENRVWIIHSSKEPEGSCIGLEVFACLFMPDLLKD